MSIISVFNFFEDNAVSGYVLTGSDKETFLQGYHKPSNLTDSIKSNIFVMKDLQFKHQDFKLLAKLK